MNGFESISEECLARLDALIGEGERLPPPRKQSIENPYTGGSRERVEAGPASRAFVEWRASCVLAMASMIGIEHPLRSKVEAIGRAKSTSVNSILGILGAARRAVAEGHLVDVARGVEEGLLVDMAAQARDLLRDDVHSAKLAVGAILAGIWMERRLRAMCQGLNPPAPIIDGKGRSIGMEALINGLASRGALSQNRSKMLKAWAAQRNSAAHGKFKELDAGLISGMLKDLPDVLQSTRAAES